MVVFHPLLPNQKEKLLAIFVEVTGNIDGTVEIPAELVVPESSASLAVKVAAPRIRIEIIVAKIFEGAPMKVA